MTVAAVICLLAAPPPTAGVGNAAPGTPEPYIESVSLAATYRSAADPAGGRSRPTLQDGTCVIRYVRPDEGRRLLTFRGLQIPLRDLQTQSGQPAAFGLTPEGVAVLECRQPSGVLRGRFEAFGERLDEVDRFSLGLPAALSKRLELTLPRGLVVSAGPSVVLEQLGDSDSPTQVWEVRAVPGQELELTVRPENIPYQPTRLLYERADEFQVDETEVRWVSELTVRSYGGDPGRLAIALIGTESVDTVRLGGERLPATDLSPSFGGRRRLPVPVIGAGPYRIELEGRLPRPRGAVRLPSVVVDDADLTDGRATVTVAPAIRLEDVTAVGYSQTASSLDAGGDRVAFRQTARSGRLTVRAGPPRPRLLADYLHRLDDRQAVAEARVVVGLTVETGSLFEVACEVSEGWDVVGVDTTDVNRVTGFTLDPGDETKLRVQFAEPLAPRTSAVFVVRLREASGTGEASEPPGVSVIDAQTRSRFLAVIGPAGTRRVPDDPLRAAPRSAARFAEQSPLSKYARLSADPVAIYALSGPVELLRPAIRVPGDFPRDTSSVAASPPSASVLLEVAAEAAAGRVRCVASFRLRGGLNWRDPSVRVPDGGRLIGVRIDGRAVSLPSAGGASHVRLPPKMVRTGSVLRVEYRVPTETSLWSRTALVPLPTLSIPVIGTRLDLAAGSLRVAAVDVVSDGEAPRRVHTAPPPGWRRRLFGPLGREAETAGRVPPPGFIAAAAPREIVVLLQDPIAARGFAWLVTAVCFCTGCWLRGIRAGQRRRATFLWWTVCAAIAIAAPTDWALLAGGAALGTLLSVLVPRRLLMADSAEAEPPTQVDSTASLATPLATVVASCLLPGAVLAAEEPVHPPLLQTARCVATADPSGARVDVRWTFVLSGTTGGVRLPVGPSVTIEPDSVRVDGQPAQLLPVPGGVFIPTVGGVRRREVRLTCVVPLDEAVGLPAAADTLWTLAEGLAIAPREPAIAIRTPEGLRYSVPPGRTISLTTSPRDDGPFEPGPLDVAVAAVGRLTDLACGLTYDIRVPAAGRTRQVELTVPGTAAVEAVRLPEAGPGGDAILRRTAGSTPSTRATVILPPGIDRLSFAATVVLESGRQGVTADLPLPSVSIDGVDADVDATIDLVGRTDRSRATLREPVAAEPAGEIVSLDIRRDRPRPQVALESVARFTPTEAAWTVRAEFSSPDTSTFLHRFDVPPTLDVSAVRVTGPDGPTRSQWVRSGRELTVLIAGGSSRRQTVEIAGRIRSRRGRQTPLPVVTVSDRDVSVSSSELLVANEAADRFQLVAEGRPVATGGLTERYPDWPAEGPDAVRTRRLDRAASVQTAVILRNDANVEALAVVTAPRGRVRLLPPAGAGPVEVEESGVVVARVERGEPVVMRPRQRPQAATIASTRARRRPLEAVPEFTADTADIGRRWLAVPADLPATPIGGSPVGLDTAPSWLRERLNDGAGFRLYETTGSPQTRLTPDLVRAAAQVRLVEHRVSPAETGSLEGLTDIWLSQPGHIRLNVPEGVRLLAVSVDETVAPIETALTARQRITASWRSDTGTVPGIAGRSSGPTVWTLSGASWSLEGGTPLDAESYEELLRDAPDGIGPTDLGASPFRAAGSQPPNPLFDDAHHAVVTASPTETVRLQRRTSPGSLWNAALVAALISVMLWRVSIPDTRLAGLVDRAAQWPGLAVLAWGATWWTLFAPRELGLLIAAIGLLSLAVPLLPRTLRLR